MNIKKITLPAIPFKDIFGLILGKLKIISIVSSILLLLGFGWFLYQNFYTTIISAREIVILESEVSSNTVDIHLLQRVERSHNTKQTPHNKQWSTLRTVFTGGTLQTINDTDTVTPDPFDQEITPRVSF